MICVYRLGISDRVFGDTAAQTASCHSSYDNLESEEETGKWEFQVIKKDWLLGICSHFSLHAFQFLL